jgi:hypothetical protein
VARRAGMKPENAAIAAIPPVASAMVEGSLGFMP